jgi:hypothetical protein
VSDRKFAMTKIARGDYLLPSNDRKTLWRLTEYQEDGLSEVSADGKNWHKLTGTFWQTAKYRGSLADNAQVPDDFLEWDRWETWETGLLKRKYAVEAALNHA